MYKILVVDEGRLDRRVCVDILTAGLQDAQISALGNAGDASVHMKNYAVDLVVVDVPYPSYPAEEFVACCRKNMPGVAVLLTGVAPEDQLAQMTRKLHAENYLLKPFKPAGLLSEAMRLLQANTHAEEETGLQEQEKYLALLDASIKEYKYKKCVDIAKEYIDFLYATLDNVTIIRARTIEFAEKIAKLEQPADKELHWRLTNCLAHFRSRYDLQAKKYLSGSVLEEMLDIIFTSLEKESLYADDVLKKVLNYIDRNIKKGINLDEAAAYVNMSSSYFSKFFKKEAGVNFIQYVTDRKIDYAKEMLRDTDMPVINIAYELSYNETSYFSKAFKKKVGITPTEYREQVLAGKKGDPSDAAWEAAITTPIRTDLSGRI